MMMLNPGPVSIERLARILMSWSGRMRERMGLTLFMLSRWGSMASVSQSHGNIHWLGRECLLFPIIMVSGLVLFNPAAVSPLEPFGVIYERETKLYLHLT